MRSGRITAEQLREAVDRQEGDREHKLGEILVSIGFLPREELERYIRVQIEEAVYYLFTWTSGTFNFEAGVRPEREDFLVRINPEYLLLEGARRVDEWSLIEKKIPSFDLIFAVDGTHIGESAPELSDGAAAAGPAAGRHPGRAAAWWRRAGWSSSRSARRSSASSPPASPIGWARRRRARPRVNDSRVDEHRNLGIAFYKAAMLDEALREFRRVADLRPADASAPFFLGLIALRQARWEEAVTAFRQAIEKGGQRAAGAPQPGPGAGAAGTAGRGRHRATATPRAARATMPG